MSTTQDDNVPPDGTATGGTEAGGPSAGAPASDPIATSPPAEGEAPVPDTPEALMEAATQRIQALEAEVAEMKDRWMRAEAEMANLRTRTRREVEEARQFAVHAFAKDVVEAAENLRRGLAALPAAQPEENDLIGKMRAGFEGVERSFLSLLERHGVKSEDPTGAPFDPNRHQAMAEQESAAHPPGSVIQAWTAAWTLNGRLLRPAMVVVAKAPPAEIPAPAAACDVPRPAPSHIDKTV
jgi:molecular chaperone GrpE